MTAAAWVRRARLRLALLGMARAFAWAGAVLFAGLAAGTFTASPALHLAAQVVALGTLVFLLWQARFVRSLPRVALWLEERLPELRYALVTAIDPQYAASFGARVEPLLRRVDPNPIVRRAALRSVLLAVAALALAAAAFAGVPAPSPGARSPAVAATLEAEDRPSRLEPLTATVTPPTYALASGVEPVTLDDPTTIDGLAGSTVEVNGPGEPGGMGVQLGDSTLGATVDEAGGGRWVVTFTLPDSATALRLEDRDHHRLVVVAPARDRRPSVQLLLPARDTTVLEPTGSLSLDARLTDDIGLTSARFEYIVASGDREGSFTARDGVLAARRINEPTARDERVQASVPFATFELEPGDQLTVRAVATDNNAWDGPGVGYSEARTLRVARPGEYDSLAVDPAPPPAADSTLMTLRWLIELVERLDASRDDLERGVFVDSARGFGSRTERLRTRVQHLQADHTSGGLFPPNVLLATAYRALIEGEYALKAAETGASLPHLRDALNALQEYASADRYYLRGRAPEELVDLARVRLTGQEEGHATARFPRGLADTTRIRLRRAYAGAVRLLATAPDSARERLALIQMDALRADPALAAALGDAVATLQAGGDAAPALQRARRIMDGPVPVPDTLSHWTGGW